MPEHPKGRDDYEKGQHRHKYESLSSQEELGDMHLTTENYSVALEYYGKALQKILPASNPSDLLRMYLKISDCYRQKGLLREAVTYLQSAEANCDEEDTLGKGTIAYRRGTILNLRGRTKQALREACTAYRILRTSDEHRDVAATQNLIAVCYSRLCQPSEAEQYYLDALSSYRRIEDSVGESQVLNDLGLFHKNACRWGRALYFLNRALEICDKLGLTQHRIRVKLNLGIVYMKMRNFTEAISNFTVARHEAKRIGDDLKYTRATLMLGVAKLRSGDLSTAEKHMLEAKVLAERRIYLREIVLADEFLGDLMRVRGNLKNALENYNAGIEKVKKISPEGDIMAELLCRLANLYLLLKKPDKAIKTGKRAMEVAAKCGELHELGFVERSVGQAYIMAKRKKEAEKYLNSSVLTFLKVNNAYESYRSKQLLGEYMLKLKDRPSLLKAKRLLGETISFFEKHEEYRDMAESHFLLAKIEIALRNKDKCLMHVYEAQRLAEDMGHRNFTKRLRRLRRRVEEEIAGAPAPPVPSNRSKAGKQVSLLSNWTYVRSYIDFVLRELMGKLAFEHGFVAVRKVDNGKRGIRVLAQRGMSERASTDISRWFLDGFKEPSSNSILITDVQHDGRYSGIREKLPGKKAPVYMHPISSGRDTFGLLFFQQPEEEYDEKPKLGPILEAVSIYAGFIGFLVRGFLETGEPRGDGRSSDGDDDFRTVITQNQRMLRVLNLVEKVAISDSTVLLVGETGTGKGLIAKAIHRMSRRNDKKFIHVNCAALPETILESELFGHVKGAFTGAIVDKKGLIAEANKGTIFLDEIGKTSLPLQGKLLQFLDTSKVRPVGSNTLLEVDVRLIFASKVNLLALCKKGMMLEDFYYRINDFPVVIPPLRERENDIRLLAEHYLKIICDETGKSVSGFTGAAVSKLEGYDWPGNVRELAKMVRRAIILAEEGSFITPSEFVFKLEEESCGGANGSRTLPEKLRSIERDTISEALQRCSWNRSEVARRLDISYPTLLKKIREFGLTQQH